MSSVAAGNADGLGVGAAAASRDRRLEDFERLAFSLESQLEALCDGVVEHCAARGGLAGEDAARRSGELRDFVRITTIEALGAFAGNTLPDAAPPSAALASRLGMGFGLLLTVYRSAHMVLWQAWFDLVENSALDLAARREMLSRGSDFFFAYTGALCDLAASQSPRAPSGSDGKRLEAVRSLLAGDASAARALGLDLGFHHLALVAAGPEARAACAAIAELLGRPLLAVDPHGHGSCCWAWVSGARPLGEEDEERLAAFVPRGARVAVGLEVPGLDGFRSSHRQALRADDYAGDAGPPLLFYESVAVEVLAIENEEDARAFVAHQLRGIEDDSSASRRIRETLLAYFAAEHNAASAAAALGVHQQTVANRLRAAEERLGGAIGSRRVELEVALRLKASLERA